MLLVFALKTTFHRHYDGSDQGFVKAKFGVFTDKGVSEQVFQRVETFVLLTQSRFDFLLNCKRSQLNPNT